MHFSIAPIFACLAACVYWGTVLLHETSSLEVQDASPEVVLPAPAQVLLYFGDRFLAGNVEQIRAMALTGATSRKHYLLRSHIAVSELHPCHEDNYWIGNASLSWGGAVDQGFILLDNATRCRFWDEWPPFFYGFNQNFFLGDVAEARRLVAIAASRSEHNKAMFQTYSTMLAANKINNMGMALKMLEQERDQAEDEKLKERLSQRVIRLQGLITLRDAQTSYEKKFHKKLVNPKSLLDQGFLEKYPEDPLKVGYEFRDGAFHLKQIKYL